MTDEQAEARMDGSLACACAMRPSTWHVHFPGGTVEIPVETLTAIIDYRDPQFAVSPSMPDDPGLTTDEKLAFEALWRANGPGIAANAAMLQMRTAARAAVQTRVEALEDMLTEAIPVLKGFCDKEFTPDGSEAGYAEVVRGYTPQGIHTLKKLVAMRDALTATEQGGPDG